MPNDDRVVALLEQLVIWTRFAARDNLIAVLRDVLTDPRHMTAYELSDGTRTQKEVGDASGLSQPTVSALWQKWRRIGILQEQSGRLRHLASLADLGIEPPPSSGASASRARTRNGQLSKGIVVDE